MTEIEERLSKGRTLPEILIIAKELKQEGKDILEINAEVFKRRKALVQEVKAVLSLNKVLVPVLEVPRNPITRLNLNVNNKRSSIIKITENGTFEW